MGVCWSSKSRFLFGQTIRVPVWLSNADLYPYEGQQRTTKDISVRY